MFYQDWRTRPSLLAYNQVALPALAAGRMDIRYADMGTSACTTGQNPPVWIFMY